jgi:hypothetical protein
LSGELFKETVLPYKPTDVEKTKRDEQKKRVNKKSSQVVSLAKK